MGQPYMAGIIRALGITSPAELVLPLTAGFAAAALLAAAFRLALLWGSIRLANATGADLSLEVYRRTLYQPYRVHVARNSSEIISGITQKVATATGVLISFVAVLTSAILFSSILFTLLVIDPVIAAGAVLIFGAGYGMVAVLTGSRLASNSCCIAGEQTQVVKALQEGLGAIRDVLLDGAQAVYCSVYDRAVRKLQRANGENSFLSQSPRYAMEALGMLLVAALAYILSGRPGGVQAAMPLMAAMALGAQRLLPLLQQLYGNWSVVAGSRASLVDVLALLDQPLPPDVDLPDPEPMSMRKEIRFEGVGFRYSPDGPWVLRGIDLEIRKGSRVGLVGTTGSGKSTAIDLLMGLLDPTEGRISVDGRPLDDSGRRAWQRAIAHVPQSIFLSDSSIAENIAFGVPAASIDMRRVKEAAARAQIADFIESRPGGYGAMVGERGVRLSGGQRQRIGIARALYKRAQVLIFDEATSALDNATEKVVMEAIESLDRELTIV
ncbi:MAG TPA: ABC transporter ATP-binding protein, partial [Elusimicrobiales bacterium]|nr:ABC transporter ATP-binding protein [Elusimicrobiales bacterium]